MLKLKENIGMKKKLLGFCAAASLVLGATHAVAEEPHWYLGGSAASFYLDSSRDLMGGDQESTSLGGQIGYQSTDGVAFELGYFEDIGGDDIKATSLSVLGKLGGSEALRPYVIGGFNHFDTDLDTAEDNTTFGVHLGLGLSSMVSEALELRGDVRGFWGPGDDYADAAVTVGLNYHFGAKAAPVAVQEPQPAPEPKPQPAEEPETRTITIRLNVEFEFDKAIVRAIYGDELQAVANAMKEHDDILLVLEGHTDAIGTDAYNQDLSERRAAAVKAKLAEDYGIPESRISTVGYGESRPIADNSTDEGRARNRRVIGEMTYTEVVTD